MWNLLLYESITRYYIIRNGSSIHNSGNNIMSNLKHNSGKLNEKRKLEQRSGVCDCPTRHRGSNFLIKPQWSCEVSMAVLPTPVLFSKDVVMNLTQFHHQKYPCHCWENLTSKCCEVSKYLLFQCKFRLPLPRSVKETLAIYVQPFEARCLWPNHVSWWKETHEEGMAFALSCKREKRDWNLWDENRWNWRFAISLCHGSSKKQQNQIFKPESAREGTPKG